MFIGALTFYFTFREAREFLKVVQSDYLQKLVNLEVEGVNLEPPKCLPW